MLPAGVSFVSATPTQTSFDGGSNTVTWNAGSAVPGFDLTYTITVQNTGDVLLGKVRQVLDRD